MKIQVNGKDVLFKSATWRGSVFSPARILEFDVPESGTDTQFKPHNFQLGQVVKMFDERGQMSFMGFIFAQDVSFSRSNRHVVAYDHLVYLMKSKGTFNFKGTTLNNVVQTIAKLAGIQVASVSDGGTSIKMPPMQSSSFYNVVMKACNLTAQKTGRRYLPLVANGKLNVIRKGLVTVATKLEEEINILDSAHSESIENVVNRVVIVNEKGVSLGKIDGSGQKQYGILQSVYTKAKKEKDYKTKAKALLRPVEYETRVSAIGDMECITGRAVAVVEPFTKLKGKFYIDEDIHTFQDDTHTMQLKLNFSNIMDGGEGV
ncbi:XkdQ/YqbQ family protein [Paenibacillus apiarius]|uniref:XkdQ/YqbQ family protein n=1 Tax=Paenibacillus apiarius TaxID=46240 RepID=UPI003B3B5039